MATRIYQPVPLAIGKLLLDEKASHHLARVLRATVGDEIKIFNGEGGEYAAIITAINKKNVEVDLQTFSARSAESPVHIMLAQGIARGEKMDFVMQKAVELGVAEIFPLITERCNVRLDKERELKRMEHWRAVVVSACEQSGRTVVPVVHEPQSLSQWVSALTAEVKFILLPEAKQTLGAVSAAKNIALLIGPEGGLSAQEINLAEKNGFTALNLGPRILRTETATLAALTVVQYHFGDLHNVAATSF